MESPDSPSEQRPGRLWGCGANKQLGLTISTFLFLFFGRNVTEMCSGRKYRSHWSAARMLRGPGIGGPQLPERGGVATWSNTQVLGPPPGALGLAGRMALVCDA